MSRILDAKRELDWRKCVGPKNATIDEQVEAFAHFCEHFWFIRTPHGRVKLKLRQAQKATVKDWLEHRYTIVLKARQLGFSTLAGAFAFWLTFFWPDRLIVILSKGEREAVKLLLQSKRGYKYLPQWMRDRGPVLLSEHQQKMPWSNDSSIESLPSKNDPARGESVYWVFIDEWAFLDNPEEAWAAIEPITDVGGRVSGISTAKGAGTFFHQMWVGSTTGNNEFYPIFHPYWADDRRGDDWYESKRRNMPDWQLHQEYPRDPEEAFIKSGNPVFNIDVLLSLPVHEPQRGHLVALTKRNTDWRPGPDGPLAVWEPPQPRERYVIGADVAEGLEHGDYSSAHVVKVSTGLIAAHWHGHIDPDQFGELLCEIGWWYNGALLGVEINNHGISTMKAVQRYGYRNYYRQRSQVQRAATPTEQMGWRTTATTKPLMIDELAAAVRERDLDLLCSHTIAELKTYVRLPDGKTSGSPYDDRVMSLAVANQMLKHSFNPAFTEPVDDTWTVDWWVRQALERDKPLGRQPIGAHSVRRR